MARYLSGRSKTRSQSQLSNDRGRYLSIDQAEPNLGDPTEFDLDSSLPPGPQYQIISVIGRPGLRYWVPRGGGLIPGAITVFNENSIVPSNLGVSSITQLIFKGAAIKAEGYFNLDGSPGIGATITVFAPGSQGQFIINNSNEFTGVSSIFYDVSNNYIGVGTNVPTQSFDVNGNIRLRKTIYDWNNNPGFSGDLLVKNSDNGISWTNRNTITTGAGGTIGQIQYHSSAGLVDGAQLFYYDYLNNRVGIGSTQPKYLLDVAGISSFTGTTYIDDLNVTKLATLNNLNVTGLSTFAQLIDANGGATIDNIRIGVAGDNEIDTSTGNLILNSSGGTVNVNDNLTVSGITSVGFITANNAYVSGILTAANLNFFDTSVTFLRVTGIATINTGIVTNLNVTGVATNNNLNVTTYLNVPGNANFQKQVDVNNLRVTGVSTLGNVVISGNTVGSSTGNLILDSAGFVQSNDRIFVNETTESTNTVTGSFRTLGGIGVSKNANIGGNFSVAGTATLASSGGITTTGGDLYVGGDLFIKDDLVFDDVNANSGTFLVSLATKDFNATGITSISYLNATSLNVTGFSTFAQLIDANGGATIDNIRIGVAGDNEIDTSIGNLILNSSGGTVNVNDNLTVSGISTFEGTATFNGNVVFGDNSATDIVSFASTIGSNIIPSGTTGTYNLGSTGSKWNNVYANTFFGAISGNADSATKLLNARTFSISGSDVTASPVVFDGTANVALAATLTNTGVTSATYGSSTAVATFAVDAKGRLTSASNVNIDFASATVAQANKLTTARTFTISGDVDSPSYSFDGTANINLVTTLDNTGVTSTTYGTATTIPVIAVDAKGRITSATTVGIAFSTATVAQSDTVKTISNATNATHFLTFVDSNNGVAGYEALYTDAEISYNPSSNLLSTGNLIVAGISTLNGNLTVTGISTHNGNAIFNADATFNGNNVTLGNATTDTVTFTSTVNSNIIPSGTTGTYNLGSSGTKWNIVYANTFNGAVTGNADSATKLQTARNFSISGDVSAPNVAFDGTGNVNLSTTLATITGLAAGTYGTTTTVPVITVDTKGRITSATTVGIAFSTATVAQSDTVKTIIVPGTAATNHFLTFVDSNNAVAGYETLYTDTEITYNPSSNLLTVGNLTSSGTATVNGTATFNGNATFNGSSVVFGDNATTDTVSFNLTRINSNIIPSGTTGTYDLGSTDVKWRNVYANTIIGSVTGNADSATKLQTARNFSASGDVNAPNVSFDGTGNVTLSTTLATIPGLITTNPYGSTTTVPVITVDNKGRITSITTVGIAFSTATVAQSDTVKTVSASGTANTNHFLTFVDSNNGVAGYEAVYTDAEIVYNPVSNLLSITNLSASGTATFTGNAIFSSTVIFGDNAATDTVTFTSTVNSSIVPTNSAYNLGSSGTKWNIVYANTFNGAVIGNADTATKLATPRNFSASGDVNAPNVAFDGTGNVTLSTTLATITGLAAGTYGATNGASYPRVTVDVKGRITSITEVPVNFSTATVAQANKLTTPRTFSASGDVNATGVTFDGTSDVTLSTTLATIAGLSAGAYGNTNGASYPRVTVDVKGRITSITEVPVNFSTATVAQANTIRTVIAPGTAVGNHYLTFVDTNNPAPPSSNIYETLYTDTEITYNPSSNLLTVGNLTSSGTATVNGTATLNGAVVFNSTVNSSIVPTNSTYNLGTSLTKWNVVYANTFNGSFVGNADSATKLATPRTFSASGDVNATGVTFDGTGDVTLSTTLATIAGLSAGIYGNTNGASYPRVTVDTKGRITSITEVPVNFNAATVLAANKLTTPRTFSASGDVNATGVTFDGTGDVTLSTTLATIPGLAAITYGSSTTIPVITVDTKGRVTAASNIGINVSAATVAQARTVKTIAAPAGANANHFLTFVDSNNPVDETYETVYTDAEIVYNPVSNLLTVGNLTSSGTATVNGTATLNGAVVFNSTIGSNIIPSGTRDLGSTVSKWNVVYANTFDGTVSGNASSATKLATPRTFSASGDVNATGVTFDGTGNVNLSTTLATITGLTAGTYGSSTSIPSITVDAKGRVTAASSNSVTGLTAPVGTIITYAGDLTITPADYLPCNGAPVSRTVYPELFAVIKTNYGAGDGVNTFNLPNLQDRFVAGSGGTYGLGSTGGASTVALQITEIPSHNHPGSSGSTTGAGSHGHNISGSATGGGHSHTYVTATGSASKAGAGNPVLQGLGTFNTGGTGEHSHTVSGGTTTTGDHSHTSSVTVLAQGGGQAHENKPPYIALRMLIKFR